MITNLGIPFIFNPENYYNQDLIHTQTQLTVTQEEANNNTK